MSNREPLIRASDIGLYVFCARAWRFKADGYESTNLAEMSAGTRSHRAHGTRVALSRYAGQLSIALLVLALLVLALWSLIR